MTVPKLSDLIKTWLDSQSVVYTYSEDDKFDIDSGSLQIIVGSCSTPLTENEVLIISNLGLNNNITKTITKRIIEEPIANTTLHAFIDDSDESNKISLDIGDFSLKFCKIDCRDSDFFKHIEEFVNLHLNKQNDIS